MRKLGVNQQLALDALKRHGGWSGWTITNTSTTIRILESLVRRGLVVRTEVADLRSRGFHPYLYNLTEKDNVDHV